MSDNPNQPREYDAVLGGQTPPPVQGVILGGIEGVKHRLSSSNIEARTSALSEALNYGETGLNLVIQALDDKFRRVRHTAAQLLRERNEAQVKLALQNYKFWSAFEKLNGLPGQYATTFANRRVIEFDPKIGITDPVGTAYALRVNYRWQGGFNREPDASIVDKLQLFVQDPLACQIEALVIGFWCANLGYDWCSRHVVDALIDVYEQLPNLKALFLGDIEDSECMISSITQSNISLIFVAYPQLEVLKIRGDRYYTGEGLRFEPLQHDNLKALIIESGGLRREVINQLCTFELPSLEYLELWTGRDDYGGTSSIEDVMPIISGQQFPKLKYLGLRNSEYTDDIAFALVRSPLIEQLIELDFSRGTLADEGAEALLNCPAVHQLDTLNVDDNCLSRPMVARLKQLEIEVIANTRQKSSNNYRYCSVAE